MSRYPVLYQDDARQFLTSRDAGEPVSLREALRWIGTGQEVSLAVVNQLRRGLEKLKSRYPSELRTRDPQGGRFESEACVVVHQSLAKVDHRALVDRDFWTYLAVDLADIVEWRFGSRGRATKLPNYGIGARSENLVFRLWLRADIGHIAGEDPYELARFGDQDLWRSHVLRQNYANARYIARSLLKLQSGRLIIGKKPAKRLAGGNDPQGVRELAKRLRRMRANVLFEYLTADEAEHLVDELSADLKKSA